MTLIRSVVLVAVALSAALVPQMPTQASELVKLGRLIVTGKRAPAAPLADESKVTSNRAAPEPADRTERPAAAARAAEPVADAREPVQVMQADRPAEAPNKSGLDRGQNGNVSSSSSESGGGLRILSLKGLLRAV